jgi:hypothetical protein
MTRSRTIPTPKRMRSTLRARLGSLRTCGGAFNGDYEKHNDRSYSTNGKGRTFDDQ